ncbi:Uncharacterised protein [Vibrio cholerae]|nr:Uncharacterised protein [Vibrio cholerae]
MTLQCASLSVSCSSMLNEADKEVFISRLSSLLLVF